MHTEQDLTTFLTTYPYEMAFGDDDPESVLDRWFVPDFEYYNDGLLLDRQRMIAHVRPVRRTASELRVDVHGRLLSGDRIAAHYTLHATLRNRGWVSTEICMVGRLADDGRIRRIDQLTRILPADGE